MRRLICFFLIACLFSITTVPTYAETNTTNRESSSDTTVPSTLPDTTISTPNGTGNSTITIITEGSDSTEPIAVLDVTVPTELPLKMTKDGNITSQKDRSITNNSYGGVRVNGVTINASNHWHLIPYDKNQELSKEPTDSNKLGFAIRIGNGELVQTSAADEKSQKLMTSPNNAWCINGKYTENNNTAPIEYDAIITPVSEPKKHETIASIVFVVEWDTDTQAD